MAPLQKIPATRLRSSPSTHQIQDILVADLSLSIAVCKGQQDIQLVGVQLRTVILEEGPELSAADVAAALTIKLEEEKTRSGPGQWLALIKQGKSLY